MIGPLANMHDDGKEVVEVVASFAVVRGVAQLQLEGEDHPVVQLPHPAQPGHPHESSGAGVLIWLTSWGRSLFFGKHVPRGLTSFVATADISIWFLQAAQQLLRISGLLILIQRRRL